MSDQKQAVTLTVDQLKDLAKAFGEEFRKPTEPTEQEKAAIEQDLRMRKDRGQMELQKIANRKLEQSLCSHLRGDGTSHVVHIFGTNNLNDYLICQGCQARIHAEPRPTDPGLAKDLENDIFDTRLFNTHYRMSLSTTTF